MLHRTNEGPGSPRSRYGGWLALALLVAVAAALTAPTLECRACWSILYDWRYFQAMEEVFRTSVADHHEAPLWNPYACGGEVGLANPQSTAAAPTFLLSLLLGTALGLRAALFVYLLAALSGAYALARALGASRPAALVAGVAFGGSGWFAMHLATGHINFAGAALYPWLVLCYLRAIGDDEPGGRGGGWPWVIPAGALIAWMAGLGGTYTTPMAVVLLGTLAATDAVRRRSARPVLLVAAMGLVALLVGAARFLPLLEFVRDHPRHVPEKDGNNALDVLRMFLAWRQKLAPVAGHVYWWHEYCCHLPYLAAALALVAALHKAPSPRRARAWLPAALFLVWTVASLLAPEGDRWLAARVLVYRDAYHLLGVLALALVTRGTPVARWVPLVVVAFGIVAGTAWPHGPWWLIRMLPVYRDLRVPARYLVMVALALSLWAAIGLDVVLGWLRERRGPRVAARAGVVIVLLVVGETIAFDWPAYSDSRFEMQRTPGPPSTRFYQSEGEWREMLGGVLSRHGVLKCDEEAPLQRGELDPGDVEQVRLLDPAAGEVRLVGWTPNTVTVAARLERPTSVLVNQNWNEHWGVEGGGAEVVNVNGRLGVRVGAGSATVRLRYRPRSFVVGAWISATSAPLLLLAFVVGLLGRRRPAAGG